MCFNSQRAQDYDLVRPYTAVEVYEADDTFGILNRNITISKAGLPQSIVVATAATSTARCQRRRRNFSSPRSRYLSR